MSIQYPYTLQKLVVAPATQDAEGNFVPGDSGSWVDVCKCRSENGNQRKISKDDGSYLIASHLIQCPQGVAALPHSLSIRVIEKGGLVRVSGQVLYSQKDRLHTRIWV